MIETTGIFPNLRCESFAHYLCAIGSGMRVRRPDRESLVSMLKWAVHYSLADGVPFSIGCIALVVGTTLSLINQADGLLEWPH
jgi:hypothetical protein